MKQAGLEQAKERLERCRRAVVSLESADTLDIAEEAWSTFITAAATIYAKLEQAAKGDGKAEAWFGRRRRERKDDALLAYIQHARNVDEHGIQRIASRHLGGPALQQSAPGRFSISLNTTPEGLEIKQLEGPPLVPIIAPPMLVLTQIRDRGVWYMPPTEHLGAAIGRVTPHQAATLAFAYLEAMIAEAFQCGSF